MSMEPKYRPKMKPFGIARNWQKTGHRKIFGHGGLLWDLRGYIQTCWIMGGLVSWRDYCEWRDM